MAGLRAIETRRPLVRVGNSGWSGWIDEFGNVRETMTDAEGSIYFSGVKTISVSRDTRWVDRQSVYVRYGASRLRPPNRAICEGLGRSEFLRSDFVS